MKFWQPKNTIYLLQVEERFHSVTENRTHNLCIDRQPGIPQWYQCVVLLFNVEVSSFTKRTDYRSNLSKTILFENYSCFSKIPFSISMESPRIFQGLISIPEVTEFGKSTANRRRSTWPILFVSFTQPCDQHDRKIRTIRKSAARWRGRRARGYRKLILRVNLLYVPNQNVEET